MKATTCKNCGAPRDPTLKAAMCRACYNAYYRGKRGGPKVRAAYVRLGLRKGEVLKMSYQHTGQGQL